MKIKFDKQFGAVLMPSVVSVFSSLMLLTACIVANTFESLRVALDLRTWNFDATEIIFGWLNDFLARAVGQRAADVIVLSAAWLIVGIFVYMLLHALAMSVVELKNDIDERRYVWPHGANRNEPVRRWAFGFGLRVILGLLIIAYIARWLPYIVGYDVPHVFGLEQYGIWWQVLLLYVVSGFLILHGLVVLVRLLRLGR